MAKIRRCRLSWQPSQSAQISGYRLYWALGSRVNYDANVVELGLVNEAYLPDILVDIPPTRKPVMIGITSLDAHGNESDIVPLTEPYYLSAPPAPMDFSIQTLENYEIVETTENENSDQLDKLFEEDTIWEPDRKAEPSVNS